MKCSGKDDICRNDVDLGTSQGCSPDEDYCTKKTCKSPNKAIDGKMSRGCGNSKDMGLSFNSAQLNVISACFDWVIKASFRKNIYS